MKLRANFFAAVLVIICCSGLAPIQASETSAPSPVNVPAPVTDPVVAAAHYREILARPEFQDNTRITASTRVEAWLAQWFKRLGSTIGDFKYAARMPAFESLLMSTLVLSSLVALLYIMVRLTRRRGRMERLLPEETYGTKNFRPPESYEEEIQEAVRSGNWHGAWRGSWRQFLSRLERRHLVETDRTRTNREYLAQLRGQALPGSALVLLTGMVDRYDRFIYGRQAIAEPDWTAFHQQIEQAGLLLHLEDQLSFHAAQAAKP